MIQWNQDRTFFNIQNKKKKKESITFRKYMHPVPHVEPFYTEVNAPLVDAVTTNAGDAASAREEPDVQPLCEADVMRSGDPPDQVVLIHQRVPGKHAA